MTATRKLTRDQALEVRAMDSDEIVGAMVDASRLEHGTWTTEQAQDVLLARVELERRVDAALGEGA